MRTESSADITDLLGEWSRGDDRASERLFTVVYDELRLLARGHLRRRSPNQEPFRTTTLVHEVYLRLIDQKRATWRHRSHFFWVASQLMRRVLVDEARRRATAKRGGAVPKVRFEDLEDFSAAGPRELIALDEALQDLAKLDPELEKIVEMRFFGGLSNREIGDSLELSSATVNRRVRSARAWLLRYLDEESDHGT